MAAVVNPEAWTCGADEDFTIYNWQDAARTDPLPITGRTYRLDVSATPGDTPALSLSGTVTGASGLVTFSATDTQTAALTPGTYVYAVWETSGTKTSPIQVGTLPVTKVAGS
jgi:hypothetical protein